MENIDFIIKNLEMFLDFYNFADQNEITCKTKYDFGASTVLLQSNVNNVCNGSIEKRFLCNDVEYHQLVDQIVEVVANKNISNSFIHGFDNPEDKNSNDKHFFLHSNPLVTTKKIKIDIYGKGYILKEAFEKYCYDNSVKTIENMFKSK